MSDLRDFISAVESIWDEQPAPIISEEIVEEAFDTDAALADIIFKLRSYSEPLNESLGDDYGIGVEAGCEMAAEMIENLLRQMSEQK